MSAASTTVQAAPTSRQAGFAAFALIVAALAVLTVVAYSQLSTASQAVAPASGAAPVQHDRGWSDAARHPSLRSVTMTPDGIRITGSGGGAILYNGIPYASFGEPTGTGSVQDKLDSEYLRSISAGWGSEGAGGSTRLQLAQ